MLLSIKNGSIPTFEQFEDCWHRSNDTVSSHFLKRKKSMNEVWQDILFTFNEMQSFEQAPHFDSRSYNQRYTWLEEIFSTLGIEWMDE